MMALFPVLNTDENFLSCAVVITLLASFAYYQKPIREFPRDFRGEIPWGKGFADIVYLPLPKYPQRPVIVVKLKWNQNADAAVAQIREKRYEIYCASYVFSCCLFLSFVV